MRYSTVFVTLAAAAAAVTPALSYPLNDVAGLVAREDMETVLLAREYMDLLARDYEDGMLLARDSSTDSSGAFNIGSFFSSILNALKREDIEMMARDYEDSILARDSSTDASGAFNIGSFFSSILNALKREDVEMMAREYEDLYAREPKKGKGHKKHHGHHKGGKGKGHAKVAAKPKAHAREFEDDVLFARDSSPDASGAFNIGSFFSSILNALKREDAELMAREMDDLYARAVAQTASPSTQSAAVKPKGQGEHKGKGKGHKKHHHHKSGKGKGHGKGKGQDKTKGKGQDKTNDIKAKLAQGAAAKKVSPAPTAPKRRLVDLD